MSYKDIPGRPGWQFRDNPPDPGDAQSDLWETQSNGIRTFGVNQIYTETKRTKDPYGTNRGEISATYYNKEVKEASFFSSLPASTKMPDLILDFVNEVYRSEAATKTFDQMFNFTRSGNATMVDADGKIKWAPHNFVPYSEDITQWNGSDAGTITSGRPDPDGGNRAYRIQSTNETINIYISGGFIKVGAKYTVKIRAKKAVGSDTLGFFIGSGASPATIELSATEWTDYTLTFVATSTANPALFEANSSVDVDIYQIQIYRSDLGGMVDNPDTGNSYVPTTGSARYLARRGHHAYNGTTWVNDGVLIESGARTNLITNSTDFNVDFTKLYSTLESSSIIDPSGATSATKLKEVAQLAKRQHLYTPSGFTGIVSFSIFCKAAERDFVYVGVSSDVAYTPGTAYGVLVNLTNGAVEQIFSVNSPVGVEETHNVENYGNGWYKISISGPCDKHALVGIGQTATDTLGYLGVPVIDGDGTSGIYIWGAQVEEAPTPSSYIPTNGATVTRAAESLYVPAEYVPTNTNAMSYAFEGRSYLSQLVTGQHSFAVHAASGPNKYGTGYSFIWVPRLSFETTTGTAKYIGDRTVVTNTGSTASDERSEVTTYDITGSVKWSIAYTANSTGIRKAKNGSLTSDTTNMAGIGGLPDVSPYNLYLMSESSTVSATGVMKTVRVWSAEIGTQGAEEVTSNLEPSLLMVFDETDNNSFIVEDWS